MKPVLQALVIAEHVYQDVTGKKVIAGTFNRVNFTRKPLVRQVERPDGTQAVLLPGGMQSGSPFAYINLTDVGDNTKLLFRFVNLTKNAMLFANEMTVNSKDGCRTWSWSCRCRRCPSRKRASMRLRWCVRVRFWAPTGSRPRNSSRPRAARPGGEATP